MSDRSSFCIYGVTLVLYSREASYKLKRSFQKCHMTLTYEKWVRRAEPPVAGSFERSRTFIMRNAPPVHSKSKN